MGRRAAGADVHHRQSGGRYVRMAHLATVGSHAINGVAALHTELLKEHVLNDFYGMWPERFSNKTNGVTPRRWIALANPGLTRLVTSSIGETWARGFSTSCASSICLSMTGNFGNDGEAGQVRRQEKARRHHQGAHRDCCHPQHPVRCAGQAASRVQAAASHGVLHHHPLPPHQGQSGHRAFPPDLPFWRQGRPAISWRSLSSNSSIRWPRWSTTTPECAAA